MRPAEGYRSICLLDLLGQCCVRYSLRSRTARSPENSSDAIAGIPGDPWGNEWVRRLEFPATVLEKQSLVRRLDFRARVLEKGEARLGFESL
eukprot:scaffold9703_cov83-Cylindrotheca_fusiformis.AAC.4